VQFWRHGLQQQQRNQPDAIMEKYDSRHSSQYNEFGSEHGDIEPCNSRDEKLIHSSVSSESSSDKDSIQANSERVTVSEIKKRFSLLRLTFDQNQNRRVLSELTIANKSNERPEQRGTINNERRLDEKQPRDSFDSVCTDIQVRRRKFRTQEASYISDTSANQVITKHV